MAGIFIIVRALCSNHSSSKGLFTLGQRFSNIHLEANYAHQNLLYISSLNAIVSFMVAARGTLWRLPLAFGHVLLAFFSLGFLGVSARKCALEPSCTRRLAFFVATGVISFVFSTVLAILLSFPLGIVARLSWIPDLLLCIWWGVALGLTMSYVEMELNMPLPKFLAAFAWICSTLVLILASCSAVYGCGCAGDNTPNEDPESPDGDEEDTQGVDNNNLNTAPRSERDYVPEERYMGEAHGDLKNYDARNLVASN